MTIEPMTKGCSLVAVTMVVVTLGVLPILDATVLGHEHRTSKPMNHLESNYSAHHDDPPHESVSLGQWEGSPEGIAYSEFNHALAGVGVILVGLSELHMGLGWPTLPWVRFFLPVGMLASGVYLLIWSDHDAWPIGSLSLAQTLSGNDMEMLQHKIFAVLLLAIGLIEWRVRLGRLQDRGWSLALPGFAVIGGLLLFMHMHGPHPSAQRIAMHHFLMGALALGAASVRFVGEYVESRHGREERRARRSVFMIIWSVLILLIGFQLVFYSESS